MVNYEIFNETTKEIKEIESIKKAIDVACKHENIDNAIFNIIIVDNTYIHELNKNYRGIDRPTDVITFALEDDDRSITYDVRVLGDIYISIDKAIEQAKEYGHSLERELSFLAVHGFLHLLKYDHMNKHDEDIMFGKQEEILNEAGITRDCNQ